MVSLRVDGGSIQHQNIEKCRAVGYIVVFGALSPTSLVPFIWIENNMLDTDFPHAALTVLSCSRYTWIMENRLEVTRDRANAANVTKSCFIYNSLATFSDQQALDPMPSACPLRKVHQRCRISALFRPVSGTMQIHTAHRN